jgi:hypothetical protein
MFLWPLTDAPKPDRAVRSRSDMGHLVRNTKIAQTTFAVTACISCALIWIPLASLSLTDNDGSGFRITVQAILTILAATVFAHLIAGYQFKLEGNYAMRNAIGRGALVALCTLVVTNLFSGCVGWAVAGPWTGERTLGEAFISTVRGILIFSGTGILLFSLYAVLMGGLAGCALALLYRRNPNAF